MLFLRQNPCLGLPFRKCLWPWMKVNVTKIGENCRVWRYLLSYQVWKKNQLAGISMQLQYQTLGCLRRIPHRACRAYCHAHLHNYATLKYTCFYIEYMEWATVPSCNVVRFGKSSWMCTVSIYCSLYGKTLTRLDHTWQQKWQCLYSHKLVGILLALSIARSA